MPDQPSPQQAMAPEARLTRLAPAGGACRAPAGAPGGCGRAQVRQAIHDHLPDDAQRLHAVRPAAAPEPPGTSSTAAVRSRSRAGRRAIRTGSSHASTRSESAQGLDATLLDVCSRRPSRALSNRRPSRRRSAPRRTSAPQAPFPPRDPARSARSPPVPGLRARPSRPCGSARSPVSPSATSSGMPDSRVVTTGTPAASASMRAHRARPPSGRSSRHHAGQHQHVRLVQHVPNPASSVMVPVETHPVRRCRSLPGSALELPAKRPRLQPGRAGRAPARVSQPARRTAPDGPCTPGSSRCTAP